MVENREYPGPELPPAPNKKERLAGEDESPGGHKARKAFEARHKHEKHAPAHKLPRSKTQPDLGAHSHRGGEVPGRHIAHPSQAARAIVDEGDKKAQPTPNTGGERPAADYAGALRKNPERAAAPYG